MESKKMTGAQALIRMCEHQGVTHIFGYPGGANIPVFDALLDSPIKLVLSRHEQGATHMADGYARASGKAGVALVTSGPGATNAITGILTAQMDSVPMVVICGQTITSNLGLDAFQEADVSGISYPVVKYSYLIKNVNDIPAVMKEAFYLAESGRPGPVLIDLPKDVSSVMFVPDFDAKINLPGYKIAQFTDTAGVAVAAGKLSQAKRPLILAGHGVCIANAWDELKMLAEKMNIPVVTTLLGKGALPEKHPLSLGMLGMHGTAYANCAVRECDFILNVGSRWDDRIIGKVSSFCTGAYKVQVDIDPSENNKLIKVDQFIAGNAKDVLKEFLALTKPGDTSEWLTAVQGFRKQHPLRVTTDKGLEAQYVLQVLDSLMLENTIVTTDVGQHQMWAAQFCKTQKPNCFLTSGGAGTMGFGFPAALGAQFAVPEAPVVAVVGDGGFQMTEAELSTAAIHKLPVKILILDNKYLGMVRQWQDLFYDRRLVGVDLEGNPDFVKLAEAYNVKGFHMNATDQVKSVLKDALAYNDGPCVIHAEVIKEDNVFPMIPPGATYHEMILEPPKERLEKPKGST
jgi:acetolactate synthase-1/2/3 large subunit